GDRALQQSSPDGGRRRGDRARRRGSCAPDRQDSARERPCAHASRNGDPAPGRVREWSGAARGGRRRRRDSSGARGAALRALLPARRHARVGPVAKPLIGGSFDPARIYAARSSGVVTIFAVYGSSNTAQTAQGSGFVVSREGYILTNSHVITTAGDGNGRAKPADHLYVE